MERFKSENADKLAGADLETIKAIMLTAGRMRFDNDIMASYKKLLKTYGKRMSAAEFLNFCGVALTETDRWVYAGPINELLELIRKYSLDISLNDKSLTGLKARIARIPERYQFAGDIERAHEVLRRPWGKPENLYHSLEESKTALAAIIEPLKSELARLTAEFRATQAEALRQ